MDDICQMYEQAMQLLTWPLAHQRNWMDATKINQELWMVLTWGPKDIRDSTNPDKFHRPLGLGKRFAANPNVIMLVSRQIDFAFNPVG